MDQAYTVLLVERTKQVRRLAKRVLTRMGFDVLEASDAPAALEVLAKDRRHVDLVLIGAVGLQLGQLGGQGSGADANRMHLQVPTRVVEKARSDYG